jgi:plastocyanin
MNRRFISIAALGLAALALAACGSSNDNSTTAATTAAAPAASDTAAAPAASDTTAAPADTAAAGGQTLTGTVGPGFTITMDQTSVPAGTYTLNVDDQADQHNFHFTGEGVDVTTSVPEIGKKSFQVTLVAGTYKFVCDPHAAQMKGELTVT